MIGSRIFSKKIRIFPEYFCSTEMKVKFKSTLYFDFCFVSKLIWPRNSHWNKTSTQTFQKENFCLFKIKFFFFPCKKFAYVRWKMNHCWVPSTPFNFFSLMLIKLINSSMYSLCQNILERKTTQDKMIYIAADRVIYCIY